MKKYNLLLLTGTIKPDKGIKKQGYSKTINFNERIKQYIETILFYLNIDNIDGIVFIDNSNFDINEKILDSIKNIAKFLGKDIEFLKFKGNIEKQLAYTYGYGEFETLDFLYNNSILFKKTNGIYKITGRYKIYNISNLIKKSNNLENLFYKYNIFNFSGLNMVFFKIGRKNIKNIIFNYNEIFAKSLNSKIKLGGEEILYKILNGSILESIKIYPYFYTIGFLKYYFYQLLTLIGFFNLNSILYKILYNISKLFSINFKIKFNKLLTFILKSLKRW